MRFTSNKNVEFGVIFLILFSPLAFGCVYVWAYSIMEITVFSILITLVVKKGLIRGEKISFPLFFPIIAFLALILFQMIPIPPSAMKFVSPKTHELYSQTLDGYSGEEMIEDGGRKHIIERTERKEGRLEVRNEALESIKRKGFFENWRTISVDPYATRTELLKIISYLGVFLLIINYVDSKKKLMRVSAVIIFSGIVVVFLGIAQKVTEAPRIYWFWKPLFKSDASFFGPFVNPNHFAGYVEMIIPLAIGLFMAKWKHLTKNQRGIREFFIAIGNEEGCKLILFLFFTILMVGALFLSSSRGGIISFLGSMVFLLAMMIKNEKVSRNVTLLVVFLISIVSFLLWMGVSSVIEEFSSIQDLSRDYDLQYRFQNWKDTFGLLKDFPLLGVGLETFPAIFPKYKTIGLQYHYLYLENDYLQLLCEMGLLGFGIFLWFMLSLFRQIGSGYSRLGIRKRRGIHYISFYGCLTGMVAIMIHSFWDFNMRIPSNALLLSMIMGLAISAIRISLKKQSGYFREEIQES